MNLLGEMLLQDAIISLMEEDARFLSPLFGRLNLNSISVGGFSKGEEVHIGTCKK